MTTDRATQNGAKAIGKFMNLSDYAKQNIEKQLQEIQTAVNRLIEESRPFSGAFGIGQYLVAKQKEWDQRKKEVYDGFSWTYAEELLNAEREFKISYGRKTLIAYRMVYTFCNTFVDEYPIIKQLCNRVKPSILSDRYTKLRPIAKQGDGKKVITWLENLPEGQEDRLVKAISNRRDELEQTGLHLVDWSKTKRERFFIGVPAPDLIAKKGDVDSPIPIEVKDDIGDCRAVGQALAYINKLREGSQSSVGSNATIRGFVIAPDFDDSAYYAAIGQPITILKVDMKVKPFVVGRFDADSMNKQEWQQKITRSRA